MRVARVTTRAHLRLTPPAAIRHSAPAHIARACIRFPLFHQKGSGPRGIRFPLFYQRDATAPMCAFPFLGRFGRSPCPVFSCVSFVCCIHLYTSMRLRSQQPHPGSPGAPNGAPMGSPAPRASPAASGPRSPACTTSRMYLTTSRSDQRLKHRSRNRLQPCCNRWRVDSTAVAAATTVRTSVHVLPDGRLWMPHVTGKPLTRARK
jgi:hypothetical protein